MSPEEKPEPVQLIRECIAKVDQLLWELEFGLDDE